MKTLLVSINSKYVHSSLAVWYLKAATDSSDDVEIFETTIKADKEKIVNEILAKNAEIIAFSCYIWNISLVKELASMLKSLNKNLKIVLGGPEVSYNVEEVFANIPEIDYIMSGEGEEIFREFHLAMSRGEVDFSISGLSTREKIVPPNFSCQQPKNPYTEEYFERLSGRIVYLETSRGCPYSCTYCLSGRIGGVRFFDMETVKSNIDKLSNSGTQTVKFVDRTFNANAKHAVEIMQYIISKNSEYNGICYHFEMAGDIMTDQIVEILCTAPKGLFQIEVGVQSFNSKTLNAVNRKTDLEKVSSNLKKIISAGKVHVHMDLIAGLPLENFDSFKNSINSLFELRPHMLQLGFLKLLHGCEMENQNIGEFSKSPPYEVISTPWISAEELAKLKACEDAVDRLYNTGRFKTLVFELMKTGMSAADIFLDFGIKNQVSHGESLDNYSTRVLNYFSEKLGDEKAKDIMKIQWLKSNSSGEMPTCLKEGSMRSLLKKIDYKAPRGIGVKRSAATLNCSNQIVYVDYLEKDIVTGEYEHTII